LSCYNAPSLLQLLKYRSRDYNIVHESTSPPSPRNFSQSTISPSSRLSSASIARQTEKSASAKTRDWATEGEPKTEESSNSGGGGDIQLGSKSGSGGGLEAESPSRASAASSRRRRRIRKKAAGSLYRGVTHNNRGGNRCSHRQTRHILFSFRLNRTKS